MGRGEICGLFFLGGVGLGSVIFFILYFVREELFWVLDSENFRERDSGFGRGNRWRERK